MKTDLLLRNCRALAANAARELAAWAAALGAAMKRRAEHRRSPLHELHAHTPGIVHDFRRRGHGRQHPR
jgi:hypothetical protein